MQSNLTKVPFYIIDIKHEKEYIRYSIKNNEKAIVIGYIIMCIAIYNFKTKRKIR